MSRLITAPNGQGYYRNTIREWGNELANCKFPKSKESKSKFTSAEKYCLKSSPVVSYS